MSLNWLSLDALFESASLLEASLSCAYVLPTALVHVDAEDAESDLIFNFDACKYLELDAAVADLFACTLNAVTVECGVEVVEPLLPLPSADGICYSPTDAYTFVEFKAEVTVQADIDVFATTDIDGEGLIAIPGTKQNIVPEHSSGGGKRKPTLLQKAWSFSRISQFFA